MPDERAEIIVIDSVTALTASAADCVIVAGSHGSRFSAAIATALGVRGVVFSDAGGGLDGAGVAGLALLDVHAIPAAAVSHMTARVGDGRDLWTRGVVSTINTAAAGLGCAVGGACAEVAERMRCAPPRGPVHMPLSEARVLLRREPVPVWGLDSNSLVRPEDAGAIVITGSHGGLLGGRPSSAVKAAVLAAVFNDAGVG
ncbi:MAG: hypothetical protein ACREFO_11615, partial [Acetobacteraceae bacterium]